MTDLYDILGVPPDATDDAIKAAHRHRVKDTHPDVGGDAEAFARVQNAYLILKDPSRRAHYDKTGEIDDDVDNERAKLLDLISQAFLAVVQKLDEDGLTLTEEPITAHVLNWLMQHRDHLAKEIGKGEVELAKLEALKDRFIGRKEESEGPSIMESILDGTIKPIRAGLAGMRENVERHDAAIVIVKDVDFRKDERPAPEVPQGYTTISPEAFDALMTRMRQSGMGQGFFTGTR